MDKVVVINKINEIIASHKTAVNNLKGRRTMVNNYLDDCLHFSHFLETAIKNLKKANLTHPLRRSISGTILGVSKGIDTGPNRRLYDALRNMASFLPNFNYIFDKLDELAKENLDNRDFDAVKELKRSLSVLYDGYKLILQDPEIRNFLDEWQSYKVRAMRSADAVYEGVTGHRSSGRGLQEKLNDKINTNINRM